VTCEEGRVWLGARLIALAWHALGLVRGRAHPNAPLRALRIGSDLGRTYPASVVMSSAAVAIKSHDRWKPDQAWGGMSGNGLLLHGDWCHGTQLIESAEHLGGHRDHAPRGHGGGQEAVDHREAGPPRGGAGDGLGPAPRLLERPLQWVPGVEPVSQVVSVGPPPGLLERSRAKGPAAAGAG